jgi:ribonuclease HII
MVGIDEAGRGSLAGSMYVVGVKTPTIDVIDTLKEMGVTDSKKLTPKKREKIYKYVKNKIDYFVCVAYPDTIDKMGLSECYKVCLRSIYDNLKDDEYIFDGNTLYGLDLPIKTEPKADSKYIEVSIASIIAKVLRDKEIKKLAEKHPEYMWEKHNGYPQKIHKEMIKKYGYLPEHRKSWKIT